MLNKCTLLALLFIGGALSVIAQSEISVAMNFEYLDASIEYSPEPYQLNSGVFVHVRSSAGLMNDGQVRLRVFGDSGASLFLDALQPVTNGVALFQGQTFAPAATPL